MRLIIEPVRSELQLHKEWHLHFAVDRAKTFLRELELKIFDIYFAGSLLRCRWVQQKCWLNHLVSLDLDVEIQKDGSVVRPVHLVPAVVLVVSHLAIFIISFEQNTICETRTLIVLIDVNSVRLIVTLVRWHEFDRLLVVARVAVQLMALLVQLIIRSDVLFRKLDEVNEIGVV